MSISNFAMMSGIDLIRGSQQTFGADNASGASGASGVTETSGAPSGKPQTLSCYGMTFYLYDGNYYDRAVKNNEEALSANCAGINKAAVEAWCEANKSSEVEAYKYRNLPSMKPDFESYDSLVNTLDKTAPTFEGSKTATYKQGKYVYECTYHYEHANPSGKPGPLYKNGDTGVFQLRFVGDNKPIGKAI